MFGIADYGAFVVAIIVFLAIPGPGNLALITSTGKGGIPGGLAATLGVIAGDQVLMWMAVAGVAALLAAYPAAFAFVQWAGAAYLAWLGWKMLVAKPGDAPVLNIRPRQYFQQALTITCSTPRPSCSTWPSSRCSSTPRSTRAWSPFGAMAATIAVLTFAVWPGRRAAHPFPGRAHARQPAHHPAAGQGRRGFPHRLWHQAGHLQVNQRV
jgi:leucine efflux protein